MSNQDRLSTFGDLGATVVYWFLVAPALLKKALAKKLRAPDFEAYERGQNSSPVSLTVAYETQGFAYIAFFS